MFQEFHWVVVPSPDPSPAPAAAHVNTSRAPRRPPSLATLGTCQLMSATPGVPGVVSTTEATLQAAPLCSSNTAVTMLQAPLEATTTSTLGVIRPTGVHTGECRWAMGPLTSTPATLELHQYTGTITPATMISSTRGPVGATTLDTANSNQGASVVRGLLATPATLGRGLRPHLATTTPVVRGLQGPVKGTQPPLTPRYPLTSATWVAGVSTGSLRGLRGVDTRTFTLWADIKFVMRAHTADIRNYTPVTLNPVNIPVIRITMMMFIIIIYVVVFVIYS